MSFPIKLRGGNSISELTESSVTVDHKTGSDTFNFNDVVGVQVDNGGEVTGAVSIGKFYKYSIEFRNQVEPLVVAGKFTNPDQWVQLEELLNRCVTAGAENGMLAMAEGKFVEGDSWRLSKDMLTVNKKGQQQNFTTNEVSHIGNYEDKISLWFGDSEKSDVSFELKEKNIPLLTTILAEFVDDKTESGHNEVQVQQSDGKNSGRGRLLFEAKHNNKTPLIALAAFIVLLGIGLIVLGIVNSGKKPAAVGADNHGALMLFVFVIGGIACAGAAAAGAGAYFIKNSGLACYENAVESVNILGQTKEIAYDEVEDFVHDETNIYRGGGASTNLTMGFEAPGKSIWYRVRGQKIDDNKLDYLRKHLAQLMATEFLRRIKNGKEVTFGSNKLNREGIDFGSNLLKYEDIERVEIDNGVIKIYQKGRKKPYAKMKSKENNFYPGFHALLVLIGQEPEYAPIC